MVMKGRRRLSLETIRVPGSAVGWRDIAKLGELIHDVKFNGNRAKMSMPSKRGLTLEQETKHDRHNP